MRKDWTPAEVAALDALVAALGQDIMYDPEMFIEGAPDVVFFIGEKRIGVECRYVVRQEILELLGKRKIPSHGIFEILLPREPHLWVKQAIEEKQRKYPQYKSVANADEVWLALHSSELPGFPSDLSSGKGLEMLELMKYAACSTPHSFEKIWFSHVENANLPAYLLYSNDTENSYTVTPEEYIAKFSPYYPLDNFGYGPVILEKDGERTSKTSIDMFKDVIDFIFLQPMDTRYKIQYDKDKHLEMFKQPLTRIFNVRKEKLKF